MKSDGILQTLSKAIEDDNKLQKKITSKLNSDVLFIVSEKGQNKEWFLNGKKGSPVSLLEKKEKGDVEVKLSSVDLVKIANGKTSAQKLYMMGKLKVKGNVMKVSFIEPLLQSQGKLKPKL